MYKLAVEHFQPTPILPYAKTGCGEEISVLIKDGKSDYKIIISAKANECETFAAQELQKYIQKTTGADFPIEKETAGVKLGGKYISIGETSLAAALDTSNLNLDGFRLKTEGGNVAYKRSA